MSQLHINSFSGKTIPFISVRNYILSFKKKANIYAEHTEQILYIIKLPGFHSVVIYRGLLYIIDTMDIM